MKSAFIFQLDITLQARPSASVETILTPVATLFILITLVRREIAMRSYLGRHTATKSRASLFAATQILKVTLIPFASFD